MKIAFGTDSGVGPHGENAREFVLMVEAGIPAATILQTLTTNPAKLLGVQDTRGALKAGMRADIIAVGENPLEKITTLKNVAFVMRSGKVYKQDGKAK